MDEEVRERWWWVLDRVRGRSPTTEILLRVGRIERVLGDEIIVSWPFPFHRDAMDDVKRTRLVEDVLEEVMGKRYRLHCVLVHP